MILLNLSNFCDDYHISLGEILHYSRLVDVNNVNGSLEGEAFVYFSLQMIYGLCAGFGIIKFFCARYFAFLYLALDRFIPIAMS